MRDKQCFYREDGLYNEKTSDSEWKDWSNRN